MDRIELNIKTGELTTISLTPEEEQGALLRESAEVPARQRLQALRDDALRQQLLTQLSTATNLQISQFVDNQVTDLASARTMFKRILLLLAAR